MVCNVAEESNNIVFVEGVGLHQGSDLSPYLVSLLMDVMTEDVGRGIHMIKLICLHTKLYSVEMGRRP